MTPADILAAARSNPLSAIVPTREEWLNGYEGSLRYMGEHGPIAAWRIGGGDDHHHVVFIRGLSVDAVTCGARRLHFDLRIPAVRDRLIRCGAPKSIRNDVAMALAWTLGAWNGMYGEFTEAEPGITLAVVSCGQNHNLIYLGDDGVLIPLPDDGVGWLPRKAA